MVKGQRSKKGQITQTNSNGKSNSVNMLTVDRHPKIVHGDLFVRPTVKRSKVKERAKFKQAQMAKLAVSMCWPWTSIKNVNGDLFM